MKLRVTTSRVVLHITVSQHNTECQNTDGLYEIEPDTLTVITCEDIGVINCYNAKFKDNGKVAEFHATIVDEVESA